MRLRRLKNPLAVLAATALLSACANFDPVKIVLSPVTELLKQMDGKNTRSDASSQNSSDAEQTARWNGLPVGEMTVKDKTLLVVSAPSSKTSETFEKYRSFQTYEGVLHTFPRKERRCYTTINLPKLSTAYLDDDGTIINITDMQANTTGDCSARPATRVLTLPYRWFANNGVKAGDKFTAFKPVSEARQTQIIAQWQAAPAGVQVAAADTKNTQTTTAKPAPKPAPKPAAKPAAKPAPKPAAVPVKDMGFFGHFEIGKGFGAQKASGISGVVTGLNDGVLDPNRYQDGRKVQTLEGKEYVAETIGDACKTPSFNPHHRIKVTSPVHVRLSGAPALLIHGPYFSYCDQEGGYFSGELELLPGDYEVYIDDYNIYFDNTRNKKNEKYTLTLTEVPAPVRKTQTQLTLNPGFKQAQAESVALPSAYRNSLLAQPVELNVTAPMWLAFVTDFEYTLISEPYKSERLRDFLVFKDNNGVLEEVRIWEYHPRYLKGTEIYGATGDIETPAIFFEPGLYKIYAETSRLYLAYEKYTLLTPNPYTLFVHEQAEHKPQHIVADKNFKSASLKGYFYPDENSIGAAGIKQFSPCKVDKLN